MTIDEYLRSVTRVFRKGEVVRTESLGVVEVVHVDMFPTLDQADEELVFVDMYFVTPEEIDRKSVV